MNEKQRSLLARAKVIIDSSGLADSDKQLILDRLPFTGLPMIETFVLIGEEDPFSVDYLVKNLKVKLDAQGNLSKIDEIIKVERVELEEMLVTAN